MGREEVGKETGKNGGRENCGHDVMYERRIKKLKTVLSITKTNNIK